MFTVLRFDGYFPCSDFEDIIEIFLNVLQRLFYKYGCSKYSMCTRYCEASCRSKKCRNCFERKVPQEVFTEKALSMKQQQQHNILDVTFCIPLWKLDINNDICVAAWHSHLYSWGGLAAVCSDSRKKWTRA